MSHVVSVARSTWPGRGGVWGGGVWGGLLFNEDLLLDGFLSAFAKGNMLN